MAFKMKGFPDHLGIKPKDKKMQTLNVKKGSAADKKGRKEPTYEGTDEYRPEKDIPKKEFEDRGIKKKGAPKTKDKPFPKRTSKLPKVKTRDGAYDPIKEGGLGTDEDPDTQGPVRPVERTGPATDKRKFDANERINSLEDKIEYLTNDIDELSGDQSKEATAKKKQLIAKRETHKQKLKILRKS